MVDLNDGPEGALNGELDGGLDGALEGGLDGGLDGALDDGLNGALEGKLNGELDDRLGGTFNCALNGGLDDSLGALDGRLDGALDIALAWLKLNFFQTGACRARRLKNLGGQPKTTVPGYISELALIKFLASACRASKFKTEPKNLDVRRKISRDTR